MAKKQNNNLIIGIAIIIAAMIIAPNLGQISYVTNQDIINQLENVQQGDCSVTLDNLVITQGDLAGGTIDAKPNTRCEVYASKCHYSRYDLGDEDASKISISKNSLLPNMEAIC